ncbi:MAG: response regulator [FCB group bacterium]|nr:response regulator [FCB group bacterium]
MAGKILIVDDNPNMSSLLSEMLEVFDYESIRAGDGFEAIEHVDQQDFSLVITDMRMPRMSGLDLLQKIKDKNPKLPVVIISGYALDEEGNTVLDTLADGFLNKPFKMSDIESLLKNVIK